MCRRPPPLLQGDIGVTPPPSHRGSREGFGHWNGADEEHFDVMHCLGGEKGTKGGGGVLNVPPPSSPYNKKKIPKKHKFPLKNREIHT